MVHCIRLTRDENKNRKTQRKEKGNWKSAYLGAEMISTWKDEERGLPLLSSQVWYNTCDMWVKSDEKVESTEKMKTQDKTQMTSPTQNITTEPMINCLQHSWINWGLGFSVSYLQWVLETQTLMSGSILWENGSSDMMSSIRSFP
jgi:hypothetical protein